MTEEERERSILNYLSGNDDEYGEFRSLTTIFEHVTQDKDFRSEYFEEVDSYDDDKEALRSFLDQMVADGLLTSKWGDRDYEANYKVTDQGIYESALGDGPLMESPLKDSGDGIDDSQPLPEQIALPDQVVIDSSSWTGLSKVRITYRNAAAVGKLIDEAISTLETNDNSGQAQARTLLLAAKTLLDAPDPPSDVIWDLVQRAGAVVGLLDIFLKIFLAMVP